MRKCPPFIADYDCHADYVDKKYRQQAEKVPTDNYTLLREMLILWHVTLLWRRKIKCGSSQLQMNTNSHANLSISNA